jgi:hypothetical protein
MSAVSDVSTASTFVVKNTDDAESERCSLFRMLLYRADDSENVQRRNYYTNMSTCETTTTTMIGSKKNNIGCDDDGKRCFFYGLPFFQIDDPLWKTTFRDDVKFLRNGGKTNHTDDDRTTEDEHSMDCEDVPPDAYHDDDDDDDDDRDETEYDNAAIVFITDHDVIMGRGGHCQKHPGNLEYLTQRDMLGPRYVAAVGHRAKQMVEDELIGRVYASNGRFVEKVNGTTGTQWKRVTDRTRIRTKVSQALREFRITPAVMEELDFSWDDDGIW